jgi:NAD(P)-dependent dehydrogenase (short-subunit alcohol dehydrogenase family)
MTGLLEGHLAFVTGGGSGIGQGIAEGYAREGARVIAADVNLAGAEETAQIIKEAGGDACAMQLDVTDLQGVQSMARKIEAEIAPVSILVNNAGIVRRATIDSGTAIDDWNDTVAVNITGLFNCVHSFQDQLKATKGRVINIGSIQSFVHTPNSVAYTTSKGAVKNFTIGMAAELAPHGVRVNAIGPGLIFTPLNEAGIQQQPEMLERFMRHIPMGRPGKPEDIVGPAIFLASDLSQYVTGALIPSDGGYLTV